MRGKVHRAAMWLRRFARDRKGGVALEFGLAVPILVTLFMSGVEATRYVLIHQKLERTAATLGDLVSQARGLSEADMTGLFDAGDHVMAPYPVATEGRIIISSLAWTGANPRIVWQRTFGGGAGESRVGLENEVPTLPSSIALREDENIIVSEVFFDYEPMLAGSSFLADTLYTQLFYRPRFGNLLAIEP